jgi:hypothetical protein
MSTKKELIVKQVRFWVLMAGGSTLTAAGEAAGVHRATGRKWRQAAGGLIPRKMPVPSGRYLSLEERLQIADLHLGGGVRAIGVGIGRSPATISRELRRNGPRRRADGRGSMRRTRPRSRPSFAAAGPRPASLTTPSWRAWCNRSCA